MGNVPPDGARHRHTALLIVALGAFMVSVDTTIVNINLPTIAGSFGVGMALISWVVMIYLIVLACSLPAMGKLGDIYGFRIVFAFGCGFFTVSSLLCGLATSASHLIFFRALQGIGAAGLYAIGPAILMRYIPEEKHGWALGIMTAMVSIGIATGPVLGGFIAQYASWNWIFIINVPAGIAIVAATLLYLPKDPVSTEPASFDIAGALLIFLALITLLFPLNRGLSLTWESPAILGSFALSLIFWTLFIVRERSCTNPLIDLQVFKNRAFLAGNIIAFVMTLSINGAKFLFPYFFEHVQGLPPSTTGLLLAVPAITLIITGLVAGTLSDRYGSWGLIALSFCVIFAAFCMFGTFGPDTAIPFIIIAFALEGIATGLFSSPNMNQILSFGGYGNRGMSSSVMMTIRNIASALGVAIFGSAVLSQVFAQGSMNGISVQAASPADLVRGFHAAFELGAVLSLAALILVIAIIIWRRRGVEISPEVPEEMVQGPAVERYMFVYP